VSTTDRLTDADPAERPARNRPRLVIAGIVGVVVLLGAALAIGQTVHGKLTPPGDTVGSTQPCRRPSRICR
jgi:hypothetical protein